MRAYGQEKAMREAAIAERSAAARSIAELSHLPNNPLLAGMAAQAGQGGRGGSKGRGRGVGNRGTGGRMRGRGGAAGGRFIGW